MWAWQFAKAQQVAKENGWTRFVSMQNHYNLVYREEEREMIPLCRDSGVALLPWSPLARGFLAGGDKGAGPSLRSQGDDTTRRFYGRESDVKIREAVQLLAREKGLQPATLAYAWLLHKGATAPILGATKAYQIEQAVAAIELTLTGEEAGRLEAAYEPRAVLGHA
jgi:aryl-alcohol dehydrogenase-like predicted oxidoreductase